MFAWHNYDSLRPGPPVSAACVISASLRLRSRNEHAGAVQFDQSYTKSRVAMASSQAIIYEQRNESQRVEGMELMKNLEIKRGSTVLDLGCGTGDLTKELAELVGAEGKVVGVDPDEERLKIAREKYSASNIEYLQADSETFPVGQYDIVFSNYVMHWIKDKEGLFRRVYDNLRPGGVFAVVTFDSGPPLTEIGNKFFDEFIGPEGVKKFLFEDTVCLTADEYKKLAQATGFELNSTTIRSMEQRWANVDVYIDYMYGSTGGWFNPSTWDQEVLQKMKMEYGDGPVITLPEHPKRNLHAILVKPAA